MIDNKDAFIGIEHAWNLGDCESILDLMYLFSSELANWFCKFIMWGKTHGLITVEKDAWKVLVDCDEVCVEIMEGLELLPDLPGEILFIHCIFSTQI